MNGFIPLEDLFREVIEKVMLSDEWHGKWLNTLSYLENCGAKKIAECEHPTLVREEMLKHAAEEFRHAHYLKRQISRLSMKFDDYAFDSILGGACAWKYLGMLDVYVSRSLKADGYGKRDIKEAAYLLVTYAIELRAQELYTIYDDILRKNLSRVMIKSILLEEEEHLAEMRRGLEQMPTGLLYADKACAFEAELCRSWIEAVKVSILLQDNKIGNK